MMRATSELLQSAERKIQGDFKIMDLIRYQPPELAPWSALDRWSNLGNELNSLFEMPLWSSFGRGGQLFTGWSPALDLTRAATT